MMEVFFIQTPLDFEKTAREELELKWPLIFPGEKVPEVRVLAGGFEIECDLAKGLLLNRYLKIPNRILLRLLVFKCRDFPKLFNKIKKYEWNRWLCGQLPKIHASSTKSRLIHTDRISQTVVDGIKKFQQGNEIKAKHREKLGSFDQTHLFVRLNDDECTISLDTSGERLGLRGQKPFNVEAPIRENLAAGLFFQLTRDLPAGKWNLFDPMAGSGTMLIEGSLFWHENNNRVFAWEYFPETEKIPFPETPAVLIEKHQFKLFANDVDETAISAMKKNLEQCNLKAEITNFDFFDDGPSIDGETIVFSNPPYNLRLKIDSMKTFHKDMIVRLREKYAPAKIGLVVPENASMPESRIQLSFKNGGLQVQFHII